MAYLAIVDPFIGKNWEYKKVALKTYNMKSVILMCLTAKMIKGESSRSKKTIYIWEQINLS